MTPYYIKNPDSSSSLLHHLNETYDYICEEYHRLTKFDVVIREITERVVEMNRRQQFEDFYTGYVWDSLEKSCKKYPDQNKAEMIVSTYPIFVQFKELEMLTSAYVNGKSIDNDRIIVNINKYYFEYFDSKPNEFLDSSIFETDNEVIKRIKEFRKLFKGKSISSFLTGDLNHEFIHVFHSYLDDDKDILQNRKNISNQYSIDDLPEIVRPFFMRGSLFEMYKPIMYFNCPTEQEGRICGTIGHLDSLDNMQVQRMIKKHGSQVYGSYRITKAITADLFYFTRLDEYKNCYDFLERNFDNGICYNGIIMLAYILRYYNLFHTSVVVDDGFVLKRFKNYRPGYQYDEDECQICIEVVNYFRERLLSFEKKIRDVVSMFLRERGFI